MHMPVVLHSDAMVSMTVFDFDTGPLGDYVETLIFPEYAYFKTAYCIVHLPYSSNSYIGAG